MENSETEVMQNVMESDGIRTLFDRIQGNYSDRRITLFQD